MDTKNKTIVLKFGGSSVADNIKLNVVAEKIISLKKNEAENIAVVVSAQGKTTDRLIKEAQELSAVPEERELDMLLSTGEQVTISKLSILLNRKGCKTVSLTGWQAGIETNVVHGSAKIKEIYTKRIEEEFKKGNVVIVAGFQGIDKNGDITIENIVYMEILLEKYIAKNDIIKYIKDNVGKNHDYDRLITMCVIIKDFSNKDVDDLLEKIIKQKVILYKENCKREGTLKEPLLNNKTSIYEANVLEKIIFNEINIALENTKNKEKRECLRNILMDETGYNIKNILKDTKKLSVLFNINYNLYDFFSKTDIKNNLNLNCYTWSTDEISLLEYFRIIEHIENVSKKDIQIIKKVYDYNNEWNIRNLNILNILKEYYPYYELYKTLKFNKNEICFRVKRICFDFKNITDEYIPKTNIESEIEKIMFLKDIFNYRKQNGKSVIYANAKLESFHFCGSLLENILSNYNNLMKCGSLEFNLNNNKLKDVLINYANTPYEVKLGPNVESCILRGNVKFVTFENFQNSKVLSNAESIRKLLGIIYGYYYTIRSDFDVTFIFSGRYSYQVNLGKIVKNFGKNKSYNEVLDILPKKIMRYINEFKILETKKDANLRRTRP